MIFPPQKCGGFFCAYCLKLRAGEEKHAQLHILFGTGITSVDDAKQISNFESGSGWSSGAKQILNPDRAGRQVIIPLTNNLQKKFGW